jgi:opacity protein-like surface antigen
MKKLLSIAAAGLLLCCSSFQAGAIEDPDPVGTITASAHLGFLPGMGANASIDYVLVNKWWKGHFTVGAYTGFYTGNTAFDSIPESSFSIMPRVTYGLNINDSFEVHVGAMSGFRYFKDSDGDHKPGFSMAYLAGCRYFITDNLGLSAETGSLGIITPTTYLNIGVAYRF